MDGIASAAAVVGLVQLGAQVANALHRYASSVKKAEASCERLRDQIRLITAAEAAIGSVIKNTPSSSRPPELNSLINEWSKHDGRPAKCKRELEGLLGWLQGQAVNKKHKTLAKAIWPFKERKIEEVIEAFEGYMPYFRDVLAIDILNLLQSSTEKEKKKEHDKAKDELLGWLDGFDCTTKHEFTCRLRQDTTCDWLFRDEEYTQWRESMSGFLWLHGNPGMGKSVLASTVINDVCAEDLNDSLAYFYCDFRNSRCTNAAEVFRSLTRQLLWKSKTDWPSSFPDLTRRKQQGAEPPMELGVLSDLLQRAARLHEHPILVVDALDECQDLQRLLVELEKLNDGHCRLFLTSRTLQPIKEAFTNLPSIDLVDKVDDIRRDIFLHTKTEMHSRRKLRALDRGLHDHILTILMQKAGGMFRWVQCQLDRLNDCVTERDIHEVLDTLPDTLYDTYDVILRAIDKKRFWRPVAQRALKWLVTALKPLTLSQLVEALAINCDEDDLSWDAMSAMLDPTAILEICGSLVAFNDKTGIITLSHYSVQEYLISETIAMDAYFIDRAWASIELFSVCITLHVLPQPWRNDESPLTLSDYAVSHGFKHLMDCIPDANEQVVDLLLTFQNHVSANPRILTWELRRHLPVSFSSLHHVALCAILRFGHLSMLRYYLDHHPIQDSEGDSPLIFAARYCDPLRVQLLLDQGLDVNVEGNLTNPVRGTFRFYRTSPMIAAVINDIPAHSEAVLRHLLASGGIIPKHAIPSILLVWNDPFHPKCNPAVVRILLENGADPTTLGFGGQTSLHQLLSWRWPSDASDQIEIFRMLVAAGCDPMMLDEGGLSTFHLALRAPSVTLVRWLLERGFQLPSNSIIHATSNLDYLLPKGRMLDMLHFLIDSGVAADIQDSQGCNALHNLARSSWVDEESTLISAVRLLVENRCNINQSNHAGETPLHLVAAHDFSIRSIELFIAQGAKLPVDIINHVVMGWEIEGIVEALLAPLVERYGASCREQTVNGENALHCLLPYKPLTSDAELLPLVTFLLENGCDPLAPNSSGRKPWHLAIEHGRVSIARTLLAYPSESDTDVSQPSSRCRDLYGNNHDILHRVCYHALRPSGGIKEAPFMDSLKLLHETGYDFLKHINGLDNKGFTPLCIALNSRFHILANNLMPPRPWSELLRSESTSTGRSQMGV